MDMLPRRHVAVDGGPSLAYVQGGQGPDLILIHGGISTLDDLVIGLYETLSGHFRVTAFDRPGHGDSGRGAVTGSPWWQADVIHEASKALGLKRPVVIGHSLGGAVALAWALQFPDDVAGVVALAPIAFPELRLEHVLFGPRAAAGAPINAAADQTIDRLLMPILWRAMFLPQEMPEVFKANFPFSRVAALPSKEVEGEDALQLNIGLMRSAMAYAGCRVPAVILGGDSDLVVNNMLHGRLAAGIMPRASFVLLPGLGHMIHHFAQTEVRDAALSLVDAPRLNLG